MTAAERAVELSQKTRKIVYVASDWKTCQELFDLADHNDTEDADDSDDGGCRQYCGSDENGTWEVVTVPVGDPRITVS